LKWVYGRSFPTPSIGSKCCNAGQDPGNSNNRSSREKGPVAESFQGNKSLIRRDLWLRASLSQHLIDPFDQFLRAFDGLLAFSYLHDQLSAALLEFGQTVPVRIPVFGHLHPVGQHHSRAGN
jgi:hypothetical protein